jgi:iron complex transport system ATP-binding protein
VTTAGAPLLELDGVHVWTAEKVSLLDDVSWAVRPGEHWALLGPNGAGKSTLLSLAGAARHPSAGSVAVLGGRLGRTDLWALRERLGVVAPTLSDPEGLTAEEAVLTGATGTIRPLWARYGPPERARARELLGLLGCGALAGRTVATCSQGERQRVAIARALMADPPLLLLDEPATGLDLPAREALLGALAGLAATRPALATVVVAHHLEDLPPSTTHALLLRRGAVVAAGPVGETLTSAAVSACFGLEVRVSRPDGRWAARAAASWRARAAAEP